MVAPRTRYELRVETRLSPAALATFCVPVRPTDVPRNTVYRFRIPGDLDPYEVLHRLAEHDVQVLELRRCHEPSRWSTPAHSFASDDADVHSRLHAAEAHHRRSPGSLETRAARTEAGRRRTGR